MVSFSSVAVLLLAAARPAYADEKHLATYEPASDVTDHSHIDLDQQLIESQLELGTNGGFTTAQNVYMKGSYSKSVATLQLTTPLTAALTENTKVTAQSPSGQVGGELSGNAGVGDTSIKVQYSLSNSGCFVGANPAPVTDGCFNPEGSLTIVGSTTTLQYSYNVTTDNTNLRTIQGFSTSAESKMTNWPTYQKFYKYYGQYDYANQWVLAAFNGGQTSFTNGNADFGAYGMEAKEESIIKGTAYMNVWMYVIHEMEDAIADCNNGCTTTECNTDAVNAWDESVAFYVGSLEGTDGTGDGVLIYSLADKRCANFNTCADGASGTSNINNMVISKYTLGKELIAEKKCSEANSVKDEIVKLMTVPLVQGTIRYAYILGQTPVETEKAKAEGATFAASVLPLVADCSASDASTIYNNMRLGSSKPDFAAVKKAFENQYSCMGITCEQVGGVWDPAVNNYFDGAAPCGASNGGGSSAATLSASAGLLVAGAAALIL